MEILTIGTGSKGNCYVINGTLVIEAGVPIKEVAKEVNINNIKGVLVSHSHKDHCKYISSYSEKAIDCYMAEETAKEVDVHPHRLNIIQENKSFRIGRYSIIAFELKHDVKNFGYLIYDTTTKEKLLFCTDTAYIPYNFKGINYFLIETNYSEKIIKENLEKGVLTKYLSERIVRSHMSLENAIDFVNSQEKIMMQAAILIHLSNSNSDVDYFKKEFEKKTGLMTFIAKNKEKIML